MVARLAHTLAIASLLLLTTSCARIVPPVNYNLPRALLTPLRHTNLIDRRHDYARLFCGLLATHLSNSAWKQCGAYLELPGQIQPDTIANFATSYRVLVVPGAFSDCAEGTAPAFQPSIDHLRSEHQIDAVGLKYGGFYDTTESGRRLAAYINSQWQINQRPYILVGYSKGAADALEAFVQLAEASTKIAALISVAGAVDGSRLPDLLDTLWGGPLREVEKALSRSDRCIGADDAAALKSLSRKQRMDFLERHSLDGLRRYSIVAVAPKDEVSRVLQPLWKRVSPYSIDQDSQVIAEEGILPGAAVLGVAKADHWAVAMPFSELNDKTIDKWVDKNKFPRTALLEAAIRLVVRDLPY